MASSGIHTYRRARRSSGDPWQRLRVAGIAFLVVLVIGVVGYLLLDLSPLDAVYQTVTTITTVGFREVGEPTGPWKAFTIVLVLLGAGTVLYAATVFMETLIEGRLTDDFRRRRMARDISAFSGHTIICGFGRVGKTIAAYLSSAGSEVVIVEVNDDRLGMTELPYVLGDATDDDILAEAGIGRAATLVAATESDAANLYVTLSARALRPDLFIVARARGEGAEPKLRLAGADRVVNPQAIGASRIAALTLQPHVAEFIDVVMHDGSLEFRLAEIPIPTGSPLAGQSLRNAHLRDRTGALVLAMRAPDGAFHTNPPPDTLIEAEQVLIAIGTREQLDALQADAATR